MNPHSSAGAAPFGSPRGKTEMDDGSGSYGQPPTVYKCSDRHTPHSPTAEHSHAPPHLPTGPAMKAAARPVSPTDDGTGSYGHPPSVYVGADDAHKAHRP